MLHLFEICLTIQVVLLIQQTSTEDGISNRIVGGRTTSISNAKYLVSLHDEKDYLFCGGSLVTNTFVVTAGHCLEGTKADNIIVRGGATYLNEEGIRRAVVRTFKPRDFNINTLTKDVAVLKLSQPMSGNNIATIPLCTRRIPPMSWVKVFGWGQVQENENKPSNQLRVVEVRMIGHKKCTQDYNSVMRITKSMICAAVPGEKDSCIGDSGGPLQYNGELCGIVSFGIGCARSNYPGVYTSINVVKGFIKKVIEN